jgi:hypothetical protein
MSIQENQQYRGYRIRIELSGMAKILYRATIRLDGRADYEPGEVHSMTETELLDKVRAW